MNPFVVIGIAVAGALIYSATKTVKSAAALSYNVLKFGIYNFVKGSNIVFRLVLRLTNPTNTPLHISLVNLTAYLKSTTAIENGKVKILSRGTQIANLADKNAFTIAANSFTDKTFYITSSWANIGKILLTSLVSALLNSNFDNLINQIIGQNVLIDGVISGEGVSFPVTQVIQITNN